MGQTAATMPSLRSRWRRALSVCIVTAVGTTYFTASNLDHFEPRNEVFKTSESEPNYGPDFSYDREEWDRGRPRIVVLAGPHKTASTTLQTFICEIAGLAVPLAATNATTADGGVSRKPHPSVKEWVWPVAAKNEYVFGRHTKDPKFYAPLAALISGRRIKGYFSDLKGIDEAQQEQRLAKIAEYYRLLLRRTWEEGKNIVIGAEAFDTVVMGLADNPVSDGGEATHVDPDSSDIIDRLLGILPVGNSTASSYDELRLEDIEVQINYRTPRISHVRSIWHQLGGVKTLRNFLTKKAHVLYQSNSLALALQFVRKGIKTTLVDMAGAAQIGSNATENEAIQGGRQEAVIGGLRGVVACEIMQMGNGNSLCDGNGILHLPGPEEEPGDQNKKDDKNVENLTDQQLEEINRVMEEYDCGVWQHLQKYQAEGLLRVLHPTENLLATCNSRGGEDVSFKETLGKVQEIAGRDNGTPFQTKEEQEAIKKNRKKKREKGRKELT